MANRTIRTILYSIGILFITWSFVLCSQQNSSASTQSVQADEDGFTGDLACQSCHASEFEAWSGSHHFHAMELPDSTSVRGDFGNGRFEADGVSYRFYMEEGNYQIEVTELENKTTKYQVAYTFGWEPLQQYLIEVDGGRFQTLRASWDTNENKWFHQYPDSTITTGDWLHWTGAAQNWNSMCSACHSTNLKKNFTQVTDSFATSYSVINVSCEACHGPGAEHIQIAKENRLQDGTGIENYPKEKNIEQVNMCAACHGRRTELSASTNPTAEFLQRFNPDVLDDINYFRDGQQLGEVYKYASFLSSKMYLNAVTCTDCHDPHSSRLKLDGNSLCLQCHEPTYDSPSHHFHAQKTEGADCVNCHMPGKYYMVNDYRHDHSFRIPRPDQSLQYGTPNTCNSCHADKSVEWAADQIIHWYGPERTWHFSDAMLPAGKIDQQTPSLLQQLVTRSGVPDIVRASAVEELVRFLTNETVATYLSCFDDSSALVRIAAYSSLLQSGLDRSDTIFIKGYSDPILAVRLAAYRSTADIPEDKLTEEGKLLKQKANSEYLTFLLHNNDMLNGQILFSEYYQQKNNIPAAIDAYIRALQLDGLQTDVRLNLAILYSRVGNNEAAIRTIQEYITLVPDNGRAYYYLSLVYNEIDMVKPALQNIEAALAIEPINAGYIYNYILMLDKAGQKDRARAVLQEALDYFGTEEMLDSLRPYFGL